MYTHTTHAPVTLLSAMARTTPMKQVITGRMSAWRYRRLPKLESWVGSPFGKRGGGTSRLGEVGGVEFQVVPAEEDEAGDGNDGADPEAVVDALEGGVGGVVRAGLHRVGGR